MSNLLPAVQKSVSKWHAIVQKKDLAELPEIIHPDAVFRSPMAHTPYHGAFALVLALNTVSEVFEEFIYHREFASVDGLNVTLEFSATVNGRQLKGADFIRFNEQGLITEFEVMVRPMSGLTTLGEEMGKRIGGQLKEFV